MQLIYKFDQYMQEIWSGCPPVYVGQNRPTIPCF